MRIDPDDPRLTAYVLNELDESERREIEAALEESPEARQAVEEIRETSSLLKGALVEPELSLSPDQVDAIEAQLAGPGQKPGRTRRWYMWAGLPAAASILLAVVLVSQMTNLSTELSHVDLSTPPLPPMATVPPPPPPPAPPAAPQPEVQAGLDSKPAGGVVVDQVKTRDDLQAEPGSGARRELAQGRTEPAEGEEIRTSEIVRHTARLDPNKFTAPTEIPKDIAPPVDPQLEAVLQRSPVTAGNEWPQTGPSPGAETVSVASTVAPMRSAEGAAVAGEKEANYFSVTSKKAKVVGEVARGRIEMPPVPDRPVPVPPEFNTEGYSRVVDNPFLNVANNPLSTFSIDVDTASYSNMRRFLSQGTLPPKDAVRIEEMVNYFNYDYPQPRDRHPFSINVEGTAAPWKTDHRLVRIGLKGREIRAESRPVANLVFLLDVSGSMRPANKLPLLKQAMKLLVDKLNANDRVAIAVYAGASGLVLPSTTGNKKEEILAALDRLDAGGSTNGGAGIELAYRIAATHFVEKGINRVILATDGDFNVGTTNHGDLTRMIEEKAKTGVFLSVLGFGMGNYKDSTLEALADKGNGNYGYIDTLSEARKVLVDQMSGTLITIAKDVKIQVEFNPSQVGAYRLIGYENRVMRNEDFNDDTKDAGEIGAGHTVTALYEIVPAGQSVPGGSVDPLKYQPATAGRRPVSSSAELLTVKLRYKQPDGDTSQLLEVPFTDAGAGFARASKDLKFASSVASFGMILRDSEHKGNSTFGSVLEIGEEGRGEDQHGYRREFLELVKIAQRIK